MEIAFDYESKLWGAHEVRLQPTYLGALRLKYALDDLRLVQGKVLEVGCGGGAMARAIKAYRPELAVYGCDISRGAIAAAQKAAGGVTFGLGDAYNLPFSSGHFAAVLMFDVLEHLTNPQRALVEVHRVLEPGGVFHLFVPCEGSMHTLHGIAFRLGWSWTAKEQYGGHIQRFTLPELLSMLRREGLGVVNGRWSGHAVNQVVDVAYFTWLGLRGKNLSTSVEGYLATAEPGFWSQLVGATKAAIAVASYLESRLLAGVPGLGVHLTCYKKSGNG